MVLEENWVTETNYNRRCALSKWFLLVLTSFDCGFADFHWICYSNLFIILEFFLVAYSVITFAINTVYTSGKISFGWVWVWSERVIICSFAYIYILRSVSLLGLRMLIVEKMWFKITFVTKLTINVKCIYKIL